MVKRNISWRKYQDKKAFQKALKRLKYSECFYYSTENNADYNKRLKEKAIYLKNNMCNCSCYMCGNPRHKFKQLTIQELKSLDNFKSQDF